MHDILITLACGHSVTASSEDPIYGEDDIVDRLHVYCQPCRDMHSDYKLVKKVEKLPEKLVDKQ